MEPVRRGRDPEPVRDKVVADKAEEAAPGAAEARGKVRGKAEDHERDRVRARAADDGKGVSKSSETVC